MGSDYRIRWWTPGVTQNMINRDSDFIDFNLYQEWTKTFAKYNPKTLTYATLKLNGEAGEVAEKVGKLMRDKNAELIIDIPDVDKLEIAKELGDVLWYVARLSGDLGYRLEEIARINMNKLESRKSRGTLSGSGDNR